MLMVDHFFEIKNVSLKIEALMNLELQTTTQTILKNVNFYLDRKEMIGIVGKNGAGKSTLCELLAGIKAPTEGSVFLNGQDIFSDNIKDNIHQLIAMVFQNIDEQFIGKTSREDALLYLSNFGFSNIEIEEKIYRTASLLGIAERLDQPLNELSGGQKQLLAITEVLAVEPEVLILDEPTAQLDEINEQMVLQQLQNIVQDKNVSIIIVSHKINELMLTDRILPLENGYLQESYPTLEFLTDDQLLKKHDMEVPTVVALTKQLRDKGFFVDGIKSLSHSAFVKKVKEVFEN